MSKKRRPSTTGGGRYKHTGSRKQESVAYGDYNIRTPQRNGKFEILITGSILNLEQPEVSGLKYNSRREAITAAKKLINELLDVRQNLEDDTQGGNSQIELETDE